MEFYVGAPEPVWLERTAVPLCVSYTRLRRRRSVPRVRGPWILDSGGFTEIARHGRWTVTPAEYVAAVRRFDEEAGGLVWASPQDWMCEPEQLARTGLDVAEHQRRTVDNLVELRTLAPDLPIIPVVQGWTVGSHERCAELYAAAGVDLFAEPVVGVGSICRRPNPLSAALVIDSLSRAGLRNLHGFGLKATALDMVGGQLASSDSQAWSTAARSRREPCVEGKRDCRNCLHYALEWGDEIRGRFAA